MQRGAADSAEQIAGRHGQAGRRGGERRHFRDLRAEGADL